MIITTGTGTRCSASISVGSATGRRHVVGPWTDEPLVWYEGSGTSDRRFTHADERGSIIAVTDSSGVARNINTYDEYGRVHDTNDYYFGRFEFTGQRYFSLDLYDYKGRIYHPGWGRFMQTDPIGYGDGMNWYNYVGGDPVNRTDPSGLWSTGTMFGHCPAGSRCITIGGGEPGDSDVRKMAREVAHAIELRVQTSAWVTACAADIRACGGGAFGQEAPTAPLRISQSFTEQTIATLQFRPNARAHVMDAMARAVGPTTESKNEWGFWSQQTATRLIEYPIFSTYDGPHIDPWPFRPPGANIFTHIHPFTFAESGLQPYLSGVDLLRADRNGILVVSVSYNGIWDWADYRRCPTCSGKH